MGSRERAVRNTERAVGVPSAPPGGGGFYLSALRPPFRFSAPLSTHRHTQVVTLIKNLIWKRRNDMVLEGFLI